MQSAEDDVATRRAAKRDSLFLSGEFLHPGITEREQVRVRNLSAGGLMAEYATPLAVDTPVSIILRGIGTVVGKVAWYINGRVGVSFDHPVDPEQARKPVGGGTQTPFYAKPLIPRR